MVRTSLVPTILSLQLLGPRLLIIKFRGAQRNLTVVVAHATTAVDTEEARENFYTSLSEACSTCNEMATKVVLIDANAGPGGARQHREHIIGPHGIPYPRHMVNDSTFL